MPSLRPIRVRLATTLLPIPIALAGCVQSDASDGATRVSAGESGGQAAAEDPIVRPSSNVDAGGPEALPVAVPSAPANPSASEEVTDSAPPPGGDPVAEVVVDVPRPVEAPEPGLPSSAPDDDTSTSPDAGALPDEVATHGDAGGADAAQPPEASADADGFLIDLSFDDEAQLEPGVLEAFLSAKARWESVIVGDLPNVTLSDKASCHGHDMPEALDDVIIFVTVNQLDGPEGLLGAAGPCAIRSRAPRLPFAAAMDFDEADLGSFSDLGRLEEIVLHEMGHALGIGSLWEQFELIDDPSDGSGTQDTAFNGESARQKFDEITLGAYAGNPVPVENVGSEGEVNGHWRESALGSELMTTRMGSNISQLSTITIASLEDMGYVVDFSQADDYAWPSEDGNFSFLVVGAPMVSPLIDLSHDLLNLPLFELMDDGRLSLVRE